MTFQDKMDLIKLNTAAIARTVYSQYLPIRGMAGTKARIGKGNAAIVVDLGGPYAGRFCDFRDGSKGDLVDAVIHFGGMTFKDAVDHLFALAGGGQVDEEQSRKNAEKLKRQEAEAERRHQEQKRRNTAQARQIWDACKPGKGGFAQEYLEGRGIYLPEDSEAWRLIGSSWDESGDPMVVFPLMDAQSEEFAGVQRVIVHKDGSRTKKRLGSAPVSVAVIPFSSIETVQTDRSLACAEGPETALAVLMHTGAAVWSTLDANGLERLPVLDGVDHLKIYADNDSHKTDRGRIAADACRQRWQAEGREVSCTMPSQPGTDFLDVFSRQQKLAASHHSVIALAKRLYSVSLRNTCKLP